LIATPTGMWRWRGKTR